MIRKIICCFILLLLMCGCNGNISKKPNSGNISKEVNKRDFTNMKIAIFPSGNYDESYLFTIDSTGILHTIKGVRINEDIENEKFINSQEKSEIQLSEEQLENISKLKAEIEKTDSIKKEINLLGGWEVLISINNKKYHFNYGDYENECYWKIVKELIKLSPLKVDIHSWS